jgi:hypothetical protein
VKHSDSDNLFGNLNLVYRNTTYLKLFPTFEFVMVRKVAISALFYIVLWPNQKAISAKIKTNIIAIASNKNYSRILEDILKDISFVFNHFVTTTTIEYVALELIFEYFCLFISIDEARHLLCYLMRDNTYERDPPKLFIKKGAGAYMYFNIEIIKQSLGHDINWGAFMNITLEYP